MQMRQFLLYKACNNSLTPRSSRKLFLCPDTGETSTSFLMVITRNCSIVLPVAYRECLIYILSNIGFVNIFDI